MSSKILRVKKFGDEVKKQENSIGILNAVLFDDPEEKNPEEEDTEKIVARAEARAKEDQSKVGGKRSSKFLGCKREYAAALHRQADILHHRYL